MSNYLWTIDAGHGSINPQGIYTTGEKKKYTFPDGFTIYEGQVNRQIAEKLETLLEAEGIDFETVYHEYLDIPLSGRVSDADLIYHRERQQGRTAIFLSIHSNSASTNVVGEGTQAHGFELYTSKGQTSSDVIADIFAFYYMENFPDIRFRKDYSDGDFDKEADYYVLRKTDGPAVLVENLFFDNRKEAELLTDVRFQQRIAETLFRAIEEIEQKKPI